LQVAVSFVAGFMLGLALLGLLPHAIHELGSVQTGVAWLLAGFLVMFLIQRFLPFHHHDVGEEPQEPTTAHCPSLAEQSARHLTWLGVALGLSLHSIFDGLALAAGVAAGAQGHGAVLGAGTALMVILHKPFAALAITTLMAASNATPSWRRKVNLAFASVTPFGALLFYLGAAPWAHTHPAWLGYALAFCAGTFLCIACEDLLPELQFHSHDRIKLSLALLVGLTVAVLVVRLGHAHPAHQHAPTETAARPVVVHPVHGSAFSSVSDHAPPGFSSLPSHQSKKASQGFGETPKPTRPRRVPPTAPCRQLAF
jgi:zinc and cadmium transporter